MESNNIRIVWIPNQLSKDGRIEKFFGYENGKTLSQYLDDTGFDYKKKGIVLLSSQKGRIDDPVTYVPQSGEEVLVMPDVRDPISMALGIGWALTASITASMSIGTMISVAYTVGALVMVGALAVVGYAIFSAFQKPKSPSFGAFPDLRLGRSAHDYGCRCADRCRLRHAQGRREHYQSVRV
jgi:hypothetical protein